MIMRHWGAIMRHCLRFIALAGLWGSPISGASMNPARTFGPGRSARTATTLRVRAADSRSSAYV
jgi:glycerol uptake facilitator-like aquaporin